MAVETVELERYENAGSRSEVILVSSQSEGVMEPRGEEKSETTREGARRVSGNSSPGWLGNVWRATRLMWDYCRHRWRS